MNTRDRLIDLLKGNLPCHTNEVAFWHDERIGALADYLIANGVIVPPCKVGDIVYKIMDIESVHRQILEVEVLSIRIEDKMKFFVKTVKNYLYCYDEYSIDDFGKSVFLTREEAEQALPQPPKEVE